MYATRADIEKTYGASHLETLVARDIDIDVAVAQACERASAEINAYLGLRYALPLTQVPSVIRSWTIDLACWMLAPNAAQNSTETTSRATRVMTMLKDIAAGRARIDELEPPPGGGASGSGIPSGGVQTASETGAAFQSEPRRYGTGGW